MSALHGALQPEHAEDADAAGRARSTSAGRSRCSISGPPPALSTSTRCIDAYGNCPAWFLQTCFLFMNPIRNFVDKTIAFCEQMDDPRSVANHFALERWLNDNIPVAGETFREFVKNLYQRNELVRRRVPPRRPAHRSAAHHLPAAAADREQRSPGGAGVDGGHPAARRIAGHHVDGDQRRARRPGRRRQGARQALAGGDALDGGKIHAGCDAAGQPAAVATPVAIATPAAVATPAACRGAPQRGTTIATRGSGGQNRPAGASSAAQNESHRSAEQPLKSAWRKLHHGYSGRGQSADTFRRRP